MPTSIPATTLEKFTSFGDLLRYLRRRTGLTQLELAGAVGYSDAQISRLEQNLRLPDLTTIEARFVSALLLENEPKAVARLLELAANVRREDAPALGLCPYKGLNYFDEADADLFVGREALTVKLAERVLALASSREANLNRFLAIVGASGSGKSSLVRAGLVPALRWNPASAIWQIHIITPTARPLESLAADLTRDSNSVTTTATLIDDLTRDPRSLQLFIKRALHTTRSSQVVLVVDQFEELFALCHSEAERLLFIDNLLTASSAPDGSSIVVITLRADFYAHCASYTQLREALARHQEYIGVMNDDELRRAIEEPAQRGRWEFEPGLIDLLLHDVGHEPGALPLLSHALLETWQRRRGRLLTLSGYASSGGVRGAIAETAETVFIDQFTHAQQAIARRIFLRLTELGDETATGDTRRRATFNELILKPEEAAATQAVLKTLADARLIITSEDSAEVAHEALIREWPTLRGWLEDNRESLRLQRHFTGAALDWSASNREPDLLFRGGRLTQLRDWATSHSDEMNVLEREFLAAAIELSEREAAEREAQQQRELEAAQMLAEAQRQRAEAETQRAEEQTQAAKQLRRRAIFLTGAFILALLLAGFALFFGDQSNHNAQTALTQRRIASARELAASAIANLDVDAERSVLLALQAVATTRQADGTVLPEAEDALHRAVLASRVRFTLTGHANLVYAVGYSPDGRQIATSEITATRIWDAATGKLLQTVPGLFLRNSWQDPGRLATLTQDQDGGTVTIQLWNPDSGQMLSSMSFKKSAGGFTTAAINAGLNRVAIGYTDGTIEIRDVPTGNKLLNLVGHTSHIRRLNFSPDGKLIASSSDPPDGTRKVWDVTTGKEVMTITGIGAGIETFTPDGTRLVTGDDGNVARVWEIPSGKELFDLFGHTNVVIDVAISPDGKRIATASWDRTAQVWDAATGRHLLTLSGHSGFLWSIAFSPDGQSIVTGSSDKTAKVWDAAPSSEVFSVDAGGRVGRGDMNADGTRLVTAAHAVQVWDISHAFDADMPRAKLLMTLRNISGNYDAVFSPDGKLIAASTTDNMGIIWDAATGQQLFTLPFNGVGDHVAFSPDSTRLAIATIESDTCCTRIWNAETGRPILNITGLPASVACGLAFTPDGKQLVTGNCDGTVSILDATTGQVLLTFPAHTDLIGDVRFSPDGKRMITSSDDATAKVWDTATWKEIFTLQGHTSTIERSEFSRDGTRILTGSNDGTAKVWDAATGRELQTLYGSSTSAVSGALFSPDGTRALTTGVDGAIRVYLLRLDDLIALAKSRLTRPWRLEECQQYLHMDQCPTEP